METCEESSESNDCTESQESSSCSSSNSETLDSEGSSGYKRNTPCPSGASSGTAKTTITSKVTISMYSGMLCLKIF